MAMFEDEDEVKMPAGAYDVHKSVADGFYAKGEYRKAIDRYTTALLFREGDRISLVCRSKCNLKLGDLKEALKDAEKSLEEDKNYHKGMFQKAEVLFNQGDFEMALVFYHRGHRQRPDLMEFLLGIQKAKEAIVNCVGTPDRIKLDTTGDLSFFKTMYGKKVKVIKSKLNKKPVEKEKRKMERSAQRDKTIRQMLGDLYGDKEYMEKLLKRISSTDTSTDCGAHISGLAEESLDYLDIKTDFWQQVKPMYARKYEQRMAQNKSHVIKQTTHEYILEQLEKLDTLMTERNFATALKRATFLMKVLNGYTEKQLANLKSFKAKVHSVHGNAALEMGDFTKAAYHHTEDRDIGTESKNPDALSRGLDNLGRVYARMGKFQKAIETWERKLPLSKTPLETTWLCHELGRCYLEVGQPLVAKDYGKKSFTAALETEDDNWKLHALVLISQAEVKYGHLSSSLISFETAYEMAELLMDNTSMAAIRKAIQDVQTQITAREEGAKDPEHGKLVAQTKSGQSGWGWGNKSKNSAIQSAGKDCEEDQDASQNMVDTTADVTSLTEETKLPTDPESNPNMNPDFNTDTICCLGDKIDEITECSQSSET